MNVSKVHVTKPAPMAVPLKLKPAARRLYLLEQMRIRAQQQSARPKTS